MASIVPLFLGLAFLASGASKRGSAARIWGVRKWMGALASALALSAPRLE
jgi:hypothetical protein